MLVGFELTGIGGWPEIHGADDYQCVPGDFRCENLSPSVCAVGGSDALCPNAGEQCVTNGTDCACQ